MDTFQSTWEAIPIRHDWISYFMAIGTGTGLSILFTIVSRWKSSSSPTKILALIILCICITILDIFLGYTGLMKFTLIANNFSESFVVLCIPLIFLLIKYIILKESFLIKKESIHFLVPLLYLAYQLWYMSSPIELKLRDYTKSHHPNLHVPSEFDSNLIYHKPVLYSLAIIYIIAIGRTLIRKYSSSDLKQFLVSETSKNRFVRNSLILASLFLMISIFIFQIYEHDLGDHIIGITLSYILIATSYFLYNESRIFTPAWIADKYDTSGFKTNDPFLLKKADSYILDNDFHLDSSASLKSLSQAIGVSPNLLSQKINGELNQNFNEYINHYRIIESQKRLIDAEYDHLSIEGIGQSVGFKSKSSFYAAFKKNTSMTPSVYKKVQKQV